MFEVKKCSDYEIAKALFVEYSKLKGAEQCFVSFERELENIQEVYSSGDILIGFLDENPIGCIGFKKLMDSSCELKRLYIKPEHRGQGFSKTLFEEAMRAAVEKNYETAIINTIPEVMPVGYQMYLKYGFVETDKSETGTVTLVKKL